MGEDASCVMCRVLHLSCLYEAHAYQSLDDTVCLKFDLSEAAVVDPDSSLVDPGSVLEARCPAGTGAIFASVAHKAQALGDVQDVTHRWSTVLEL